MSDLQWKQHKKVKRGKKLKNHGSASNSGAQNSVAVRRRARNARAPQRRNKAGQGGMAVRPSKKARAPQKSKKAAASGQEGGAKIPDGPSTIQELFNYPNTYVDLVLSSQHSPLLLHNIAQQHYNLRTHFRELAHLNMHVKALPLLWHIIHKCVAKKIVCQGISILFHLLKLVTQMSSAEKSCQLTMWQPCIWQFKIGYHGL